jgi:hypothetical protein
MLEGPDVAEIDSFRRSLCPLLGVMLLFPAPGQTQRRPDFSGEWELVEALTSGVGRDGVASEAPRRTTSTTISGAAFNCGRGCSLTQKGETLTIARAQLAASDPSNPVPTVTFRLDGKQTNVIDSFNPSSELPVIARWQSGGLEVETRSRVPWKQTLRLEKNELLVVSTNPRFGTEMSLRYRKK